VRIASIVGILLIVAGGFLLVRGFDYTAERSAVQLGPIHASVEEKKAIPDWVGGAMLVGGIVLLVVGFRGRR
jgi:hypothetical protein